MKFIKSFLFVCLFTVICHLAWLIFYYLTPSFLHIGWIRWIIYSMFLWWAFYLIGALPGILVIGLAKLRSFSPFEIIICAVIVIPFAFSSAKMAWVENTDYGFWMVVKALTQNSFVIEVFWGLLGIILYIPPEAEDDK